jgi:hypothetical protein
MKISFTFLFILIFCFSFGQTITISECKIFLQKKGVDKCGFGVNNNPTFYLNGTYLLSATQFNGRNQYNMQIPTFVGNEPCILGAFPTSITLSPGRQLRIRWSGTRWELGYINESYNFAYITYFEGDTETPRCEIVGRTGTPKIGGLDCYCNSSLNLTGTVTNNTSKVVKEGIVSSQIVQTNLSLTYQAGKSISLEPGFNTESPTVFTAQIGNCN